MIDIPRQGQKWLSSCSNNVLHWLNLLGNCSGQRAALRCSSKDPASIHREQQERKLSQMAQRLWFCPQPIPGFPQNTHRGTQCSACRGSQRCAGASLASRTAASESGIREACSSPTVAMVCCALLLLTLLSTEGSKADLVCSSTRGPIRCSKAGCDADRADLKPLAKGWG
jgi:hypothetical protein